MAGVVRSPRRCEPACRQTLGKRITATVCRRLVRRQRDGDIPTQPERVVEVKMAPRGQLFPVDRDTLDVGGDSIGDGLRDGCGIEVGDRDRRADVEVRVVDDILGDEGREDQKFGGRGHWGIGLGECKRWGELLHTWV